MKALFDLCCALIVMVVGIVGTLIGLVLTPFIWLFVAIGVTKKAMDQHDEKVRNGDIK